MFTRILGWMSNNSNKASTRSKVAYSISNKSSTTSKDNSYKWDDWANRSGMYHHLPENQKEYLNKIIDKLEKEI